MTTGVNFAQTNTAGGYSMEMRFSWINLGGAPTPGTYIGFDVGVNDDDNNGTRDNQLSWNDATFGEWQDPSKFGTFQFSSCNPLSIQNEVAQANPESFIIYQPSLSIVPNPFEDGFVIETGILGDLHISIYDVVGKQVYQTTKTTGEGALWIQPELSTGAYVLSVRTKDFIEQQKIIKK
jgi:hypothetical protein